MRLGKYAEYLLQYHSKSWENWRGLNDASQERNILY